jgi:hypothetical protein
MEGVSTMKETSFEVQAYQFTNIKWKLNLSMKSGIGDYVAEIGIDFFEEKDFWYFSCKEYKDRFIAAYNGFKEDLFSIIPALSNVAGDYRHETFTVHTLEKLRKDVSCIIGCNEIAAAESLKEKFIREYLCITNSDYVFDGFLWKENYRKEHHQGSSCQHCLQSCMGCDCNACGICHDKGCSACGNNNCKIKKDSWEKVKEVLAGNYAGEEKELELDKFQQEAIELAEERIRNWDDDVPVYQKLPVLPSTPHQFPSMAYERFGAGILKNMYGNKGVVGLIETSADLLEPRRKEESRCKVIATDEVDPFIQAMILQKGQLLIDEAITKMIGGNRQCLTG